MDAPLKNTQIKNKREISKKRKIIDPIYNIKHVTFIYNPKLKQTKYKRNYVPTAFRVDPPYL